MINMLLLIIAFSTECSSFSGNRTHYPNLKIRPESIFADVNYNSNGNGIVNILNPYSRASAKNTPSLQQQRSLWAGQNNIRILYRTYSESETYDDYVDQIKMACSFNETTSFDIIWMNSTTTGLLSDCMLDLYAWNFDIAKDHDPNILRNNIINDRLIALPSESNLGAVLKNNDLLARNGFTSDPTSFDELQEICTSIIASQRSNDNYQISCITGAFNNIQEFMNIITEWIASARQTIIYDKKVTIASLQVAEFINKITEWIHSGIIAINDINTASIDSATKRFKEENAVFYLSSLTNINEIISNPPDFDFGVISFPSIYPDQYVGTFTGWSLGVYKNAKNANGAVKTIHYMTSELTQKQAILLSNPIRLLPTYKNLYNDGEVCSSLGYNLCDTFSKTTPITDIGSFVSEKYYNVSFAIVQSFTDIFNENIDINSGLENLYIILESILNYNGTFQDIDPILIKPIRKGFSNLSLQLSIFFLISTVIVFSIIGNRIYLLRKLKKQELLQNLNKEQGEEQSNNENVADREFAVKSVMGGKYEFIPLNDMDENIK